MGEEIGTSWLSNLKASVSAKVRNCPTGAYMCYLLSSGWWQLFCHVPPIINFMFLSNSICPCSPCFGSFVLCSPHCAILFVLLLFQ